MSESAIKYSSNTADALIQRGFSKYYGYTVTAATATGIIEIRDSLTAGSGTVIDVIPATTAAGTTKHTANPIQLTTGLFIDFTGTGTVVTHYE